MIRLPEPTILDAPQRRALTVLVDLARLIPVTDPTADVVTIALTEGAPFDGLRAWKAAGWGIEPGDGVVRIARAALHRVDAILGAAQERTATARDRLGRIPSSENALVAEGLEREPLVSQTAAALRSSAVAAAGRRVMRLTAPWPEGRRWAVALTHDLDVVAWWPAFTARRLAELLRKSEWSRAGRAGLAAAAAVGRAPVRRGVQALLATERARGVRGTWFVLCGTPTWRTFLAGDLTYRPEAAATRAVLADVRGGGHALGLHGSFATVASAQRFREQRQRLQRLGGGQIRGARQHFLRFDPERTPAAMQAAGFRYDSTWGFADRNGFRLGVADVVPLWDTATPDVAPMVEVPFAWMDRALSKYRDVEDPKAWVADALELAQAARAVEGLWVGVWHPNLVPALGFPGAPAAYADLLEALDAHHPFSGTLDELVAWRAARARLRIVRVAPDGRLETTGAPDVPLEAPMP
jgi:hypothetical protein